MTDKFSNSSFHREGQALQKPKPKSGQFQSEPPKSEFIKELTETGRANWAKAPNAIKKRYNGIYLILLSIPVIVFSSIEMVRRLQGKSTKKVQQGEILENGEIRKFDEIEKWQVERNSWTYKIFGKDYFLDGFTSKTMADDVSEK